MTATLIRHETPAFSLGEHEIALRWAAAVRPAGHRILVCCDHRGSEELLLVFKPGQDRAAFAMQRTERGVLLIDALGMTVPFAALVDALLAVSPALGVGRRALVAGARPACLGELPGMLTRPRRASGWQKAASLVQKAWR